MPQAGDVWVHDARLRPAVTIETELRFPDPDSDGETTKLLRVVIDEPSNELIGTVLDQLWAYVSPDDEEG